MAGIENGEIRTALSVGEVAERSGVAVSAIHFYEKKGLIDSWRNAYQRWGRDTLGFGLYLLRAPG